MERRYGIEKDMQDYNVTCVFPESEWFIESANFLMSKITGGGLTSPEIARLKKVVTSDK